MGRKFNKWRNVLVVMLVAVIIVLMSSCNNQVCPAYSKISKPEVHKSV
jgi:hypothetical protein